MSTLFQNLTETATTAGTAAKTTEATSAYGDHDAEITGGDETVVNKKLSLKKHFKYGTEVRSPTGGGGAFSRKVRFYLPT